MTGFKTWKVNVKQCSFIWRRSCVWSWLISRLPSIFRRQQGNRPLIFSSSNNYFSKKRFYFCYLSFWRKITSSIDRLIVIARWIAITEAPSLTLYFIMLKMAKHTLKILRCEHRKIFKVCLAIFQRYAIKG